MSEAEIVAAVSDTAPILPGDADGNGNAIALDTPVTRTSSTTLIKRVFSFPALLGALLVAGMATVARTFFVDPDVWWHIKFGQVILATHHWPTNDIYSFSVAGKPWIDAEWIGELLLATVYRLGGMRGLELYLLILGSSILVALYTLATVRSGNSKAGFVVTVAVFMLATASFNLRPQMLGYLFLILTLIALERFRQGKQSIIWAIPMLMVVWVNAHPSWTIGLGVIGIYLASGLVEFRMGDVEAKRWSPAERSKLAGVLALSACATLVTPYGAGLAKFPFAFAFSLPVSIANIREWLPMPFGDLLGKMFLVTMFSVIALQLANQVKWHLQDITLFIFATVEACLHRRFILILVPIFTMILADVLTRWVPRYERTKDQVLINAALMTVILLIVIRYLPSQTTLWQTAGNTYPVAAAEYLNSHSIPGPMYNTYNFGGYLILSRGPEHKVFLDGRSELYEPAGVLVDYFEIAAVKPNALAALQKYGFQSCLLQHNEGLATLLAASPDWQKVYEDETSILFVRRGASPVAGIQNSVGTQTSLLQEKSKEDQP